MEKKCKPKLGQWFNNGIYLTDAEKKIIIQDYLSGNESKSAVYKRYTGYSCDHGALTRWMRKFGVNESRRKTTNFESMAKTKKTIQADVDFEKLQLEKRVSELEKQLKLAEMKVIAFSTMVDIAEREFNIPIRKKFNTKP
jgi:transposase